MDVPPIQKKFAAGSLERLDLGQVAGPDMVFSLS
jgi:hypothetical protein